MTDWARAADDGGTGYDPGRGAALPGGWDPAPPPPAPAPGPLAQATVAGPPPRRRRRRVWPGVLALVLLIALVGLGYQTWQLDRLSTRLDQTNERLDQLAQEQAYGSERLDAVEDRTGELERTAGEVFDPEAVAAAVLPSVFKVQAGDVTGTAFAVGAQTADSGTNLLTNHHVVQQVWDRGDREVFLERTDQRYPAEIIEVDGDADIAWLQTTASFSGLVAASQPVRSGQQIVSVGAPLGLTDTVTTGVVSTAQRELPDGSGPWIQFDAAVQPGNSGGPVINAAQEVVGVTTRKADEVEGIGLAVPIVVVCDRFDVC